MEPEPDEGVVRPPPPVGPGGLRYLLEGIEIRGNTTTLARVILRFVPFQRGATLDVDDKELQLTRFRLLGIGFFRDVQLSLRRGSQRGLVVLVIDVTPTRFRWRHLDTTRSSGAWLAKGRLVP